MLLSNNLPVGLDQARNQRKDCSDSRRENLCIIDQRREMKMMFLRMLKMIMNWMGQRLIHKKQPHLPHTHQIIASRWWYNKWQWIKAGERQGFISFSAGGDMTPIKTEFADLSRKMRTTPNKLNGKRNSWRPLKFHKTVTVWKRHI